MRLRKRVDQALIPISTIQKFPAQLRKCDFFIQIMLNQCHRDLEHELSIIYYAELKHLSLTQDSTKIFRPLIALHLSTWHVRFTTIHISNLKKENWNILVCFLKNKLFQFCFGLNLQRQRRKLSEFNIFPIRKMTIFSVLYLR